jgi:hypothetical protein
MVEDMIGQGASSRNAFVPGASGAVASRDEAEPEDF